MESIFLSSKHHNQQPNKYLVNHWVSFLSQGDLDKLRDGVVFLTVHDVGASYEVESLASNYLTLYEFEHSVNDTNYEFESLASL